MESDVRGSIEKYIDFALSDAQMVGYQYYVNYLKPYVKSVEDAVFGLVLGTINTSCLDQLIMYHRGNPTVEDMTELRRIVTERIPRIRSRVLETLI